jgi:plastocyanin domain-containing protein
MKRSIFIAITLVALAVVAAGCNGSGGAKSGAGESGAVAASNTVTLSVTDNGFEPALATVEAGKPVTLIVTRKTDQTCATALIFDDDKIKHELPLNQAVTITFTPTKPGEMRYACPMNMIEGKIVVR